MLKYWSSYYGTHLVVVIGTYNIIYYDSPKHGPKHVVSKKNTSIKNSVAIAGVCLIKAIYTLRNRMHPTRIKLVILVFKV
jgi:hypothetical protein